jgi:citrate/tricarballylate utilization protein
MLEAERVEQARQILAVCNACRYCEQFCPVFPAIERRTTFAVTDLHYLANLCHNCGECLYSCQYAPPHPFGVNVPRTLAQVRRGTYQDYCWPSALAASFQKHSAATALGLVASCAVVLLLGLVVTDPAALSRPQGTAVFYAVIPHDVLVAVFGLAAGLRYWPERVASAHWDLPAERGRVSLATWVESSRRRDADISTAAA